MPATQPALQLRVGQPILYAWGMWSYVAVIVGAIVLAFGVGRLAKRTRRAPSSIEMGQLSDSWLAEQRGSRDQS